MINVRGEVLAEASQTWHHPSGEFYLLPRLEGQRQRMRSAGVTQMPAHPSYDLEAARRAKRQKRRAGVRQTTAFLGRVGYRDEAA